MANLGMTIFEHLIRQEAQKQADFERQKAMDRERSIQDTQMLQRAVEHKQGREDKEFERQYKMAELMGKYSGMSEAEQAPQMQSPELQEMADTAFMGERQRIPQMQKEWEVTKLPIEQLKTNRATMLEGGRNARANNANLLRGEIEKGKLGIAQAKLALQREMDPVKKKYLMRLIGDSERKQFSDTARYMNEIAKGYEDRLGTARRGYTSDPVAEHLMNKAAEGVAMLQAGANPSDIYAAMQAEISKYDNQDFGEQPSVGGQPSTDDDTPPLLGQ